MQSLSIVVSAKRDVACCWVDRIVIISVAWRHCGRSSNQCDSSSNQCDSETWVCGFVTEMFLGPGQLCQVSQREDGCRKSRVIK